MAALGQRADPRVIATCAGGPENAEVGALSSSSPTDAKAARLIYAQKITAVRAVYPIRDLRCPGKQLAKSTCFLHL